MDICILGMGYIGTTTATALTMLGHHVVGVEKDPAKVSAFQAGHVPFDEPGLEEAFGSAFSEGRLSVSADGVRSIASADVVMICVGTPSTHSGEVDLTQVFSLAEDLRGGVTASDHSFQVIALRSTSPPGTSRKLEQRIFGSQPDLRRRAAVVSNPEFLREGTALEDFFDPPFTVIGTTSDEASSMMLKLYEGVEGPRHTIQPEAAELLKYACNAFHAVKVAFANEVGALSYRLGVDAVALMEAFVQDKKLNVSGRYLKPGFAFGGSCLPKDVRALSALYRNSGVAAPLVQNILPSNDAHLARAVRLALDEIPEGTIGVAGLSFKEGTNDFRESPYVYLVRDLRANGRDVVVFEPTLDGKTPLLGANLSFMDRVLPDYGDLLRSSAEDLTASTDGIVVTRSALLPLFKDCPVKVLPFLGTAPVEGQQA
jgi:GDP-mannose 6-dehydrogenase